ncbi:acyl carrier protein [Sphaerisporangium sp. NPDC051017]|uniref:acyl carrier protein n=1 Tax=unclassified Sphaerisporangium TaxID=2630420 RepID=UPI0033D8FE62
MPTTDDADAPEVDVREHVRKLWLGILPDGTSGTFAEAGGDSLSGLRLLGAIHKTLGIRVPFGDLNTAASVEDFVDRVARRTTG